MSHSYTYLQVEVIAGVLRVQVNRPDKRNALSRAVLQEILAVFQQYRDDISLHAAILTGAGNKSFAAGGDLAEFDAIREPAQAEQLFRDAAQTLAAVRSFPVPVVAVLNGMALGGGAELAIACDYRIAAQHVRIGFVQGRLAISTGFGGGFDLFHLLGASRAMSVLLNAQVLSAEQASAMGLLDAVAAQDESLEQLTDRFIEPFLARPVQVVRATKRLAHAYQTESSRAALQLCEQENFVRTWIHPDHWDAAAQVLAGNKHKTEPE